MSHCLEMKACRYDGQVIRDSIIQSLLPHVTVIPVCPEEAMGLGTPRDPLGLIQTSDGDQMIQFSTGHNVTPLMDGFIPSFLAEVTDVDGIVLKSRSPSCGLRDTIIYSQEETLATVGHGSGLFARALQDAFPNIPIRDEKQLAVTESQEHFFTAIFTLARFRAVKSHPERLRFFHTRHALLLQSLHPDIYVEMVELLETTGDNNADEIYPRYKILLQECMRSIPRHSNHVKIIRQTLERLSPALGPSDQKQSQDLLEKLATKRISLQSLRSKIWAWIKEWDDPYLKQQYYFVPYPESLFHK
ncbi:MAG: YbgA family protein [Fidelibacterota bacterium]